jgi:hypothetical protein
MAVEIGILRISPLRLLVFAALVAGFFVWFGYWPADVPRDRHLYFGRITRIYLVCSVLFVFATSLACFGEHEYGMFPPTSLRPVLIILGAILMLAGTVWMHSLRQAYSPRPPTGTMTHPANEPLSAAISWESSAHNRLSPRRLASTESLLAA